MQLFRHFCAAITALLFFIPTVYAASEEINTDRLLSELEKQIELSGDKLSKMKPALDAKSKELEKSIQESVEKGFVELRAFSGKLDSASKQAEQSLKDALNGEEMKKLKDFLDNIDREAIDKVKDELVAELTKLLQLTEDQIKKLKPALKQSMDDLVAMIDRLVAQGKQGLETFKKDYEEFNNKLKKRLSKELNKEQIKKLDKNQEELREKIRATLDRA